MKSDFSGYVTRYGVRCSDGAIIKHGAFKDLDGVTVPLLWQHTHNTPENVLGRVTLEHRDDGVYGHAFLNQTPNGLLAKDLVRGGDIKKFSIWANSLIKKGSDVLHGAIREVSLVISGANEGAYIDYVSIQHSDAPDTEIFEAIVHVSGEIENFTEETIEHTDAPKEEPVTEKKEAESEKTDKEETVQDVLDTLTEKQKKAVDFVFSQILDDDEDEDDEEQEKKEEKDSVEHGESDEEEAEESLEHSNNDGGENLMTRNVFDQNTEKPETQETVLSHDALQEIVKDAKKIGSLKEAFLAHADAYGIENIDVLFPDAKLLNNTPELLKRDTSWVADVMRSVRKSPMARVKSVVADLTAAEARARGFTKGGVKVDEVFSLLARTTSPTTIYKKQKLDRDDIIDITDLDVVVWLKAEMRVMLEEEIARAILIGDGRDNLSADRIKDPEGQTDGIGIRSVLNDHVLYAETVTVNGHEDDPELIVDAVVRSRKRWRGTGVPTFYTKVDVVADLLLKKDGMGRRVYETESGLAGAMRVGRIVEVEVMEEHEDLIGILVNLNDYTLGANKGGEVSFFDDFDIDYNQFKYLYETRLSGALNKPKAAVIFKVGSGTTTTTTTE